MIPIARPWFGDEELSAIQRPLKDGWVIQGPRVEEFETLFASAIGAPFAAACSSGTTALHLAVAALGAGPGDEVVVPAFTWVSTPNAVEVLGARPVFCDIELATFSVAPAQAIAAATPRTVGWMPVSLFGLAAGLGQFEAAARDRGLWMVEDAACAFGAREGGRFAGTFGDAGCFSFHPRKALTTGEGGMVVTRSGELDAKIRRLRNLGLSGAAWKRDDAPALDCEELGYNYRMTDLQGALGCAQMGRTAAILDGRRTRAERYGRMLAGTPGLRLPGAPAGSTHGWQSYVCLLEGDGLVPLKARRDALMTQLAQRGIQTRPGSHAPVLLPYYARKYGLRAEDFPNAVLADHASLALPLYPQMTDDEQDLVVSELLAALRA